MSSSVVEMAASSSANTASSNRESSHGNYEETDQRQDVLLADPAPSNLSLHSEVFLESAVSLKNQVAREKALPAGPEEGGFGMSYDLLYGRAGFLWAAGNAYDRDFRNPAIEAGEVVWKSGLSKKVGLADGAAGNAYAFLSLYRLTGEAVYVRRESKGIWGLLVP